MSDTQILPNPPTAMLKAAHNQMKEFLARYDTLGHRENPAKNRLYQEIRKALLIHLEIEEVLFYPAVESMKAALAISVVLKALQAHRKVKGLLEELKVLSSEGESLDGKIAELQRCVLAHLLCEEKDIFPYARLLPPEVLRDLSLDMEKLRDRLLKEQ